MSGLQGLRTELDQADIDRIALEMEIAYDSGNDYVDAGEGGGMSGALADTDDDDIWMDVEAGEYEGGDYDDEDEDEEIDLSCELSLLISCTDLGVC